MIVGDNHDGDKSVPVFTLFCDNCGEIVDDIFNDFSDAVEYKNENGWRGIKDKNGDWQDLCPACNKPDIITELKGIKTDTEHVREAKEEAKRLAKLAASSLEGFK